MPNSGKVPFSSNSMNWADVFAVCRAAQDQHSTVDILRIRSMWRHFIPLSVNNEISKEALKGALTLKNSAFALVKAKNRTQWDIAFKTFTFASCKYLGISSHNYSCKQWENIALTSYMAYSFVSDIMEIFKVLDASEEVPIDSFFYCHQF